MQELFLILLLKYLKSNLFIYKQQLYYTVFKVFLS